MYRKEKAWAWHQTLTSCLTFGNWPNFTEPQFPWIQSRDPNTYHVSVLGRLGGIKSVKKTTENPHRQAFWEKQFSEVDIIHAHISEIVTDSNHLFSGLHVCSRSNEKMADVFAPHLLTWNVVLTPTGLWIKITLPSGCIMCFR